jgi:hypothetical protein
MPSLQYELLDFTASRLGKFFKDERFLIRLKKTPFLYPVADVHHLKELGRITRGGNPFSTYLDHSSQKRSGRRL